MTQPEARCLCGEPVVDHLPLRYAWRAWWQHRRVFGFRPTRKHP